MDQGQTEINDKTTEATALWSEPKPAGVPSVTSGGASVAPQACSSCGTAAASSHGAPTATTWVYVLGKIGVRFPGIAAEKEFAQATGREKTAGLTDRQALHSVLSKRENRYLLRQLCFVLTVEGLETYLLAPRDPADVDLLVETIRPNPSPLDLDVVIGIKGPVAPPQMCNGLMIPIVIFDQIYSFDRETLIKSIPKPEKTSAKEFALVAEELFDRIAQMTDNAGATDAHRALNYCAVRYQAIYAKAAECYASNSSLTAIEVRPSLLSGTRNIMEVIFSYTNRNTDVIDKCFARVDVTDEFPFLITKLSPYYDR